MHNQQVVRFPTAYAEEKQIRSTHPPEKTKQAQFLGLLFYCSPSYLRTILFLYSQITSACPPLKIYLPAFDTDFLLPGLPASYAGQRNPGISAERLSSHPQLLPTIPDSFDLSIEKELVVFVLEVENRVPVELGQFQNQAPQQTK